MSTPTLAFKSAVLAPDKAAELVIAEAESIVGGVAAFEGDGIVTAIVSVTGVVDEVDDIIEPGAYAATLLKRLPKVCWHHSWEHPIGKVLWIEELLPGDPRLPAKTRDGQPWPAEAGALVAKMQMNMASERGREAYSAIKFYSESGECEYSIGYKVPSGKSTRDSKGIRRIKEMDLFELSFVLFGAHTMTGTLALKAAVSLMNKANHGTVTISKKAIDDEFERLMADVDFDELADEDELQPTSDEPGQVVQDEQGVLEIEDDEDDEEAELHRAALEDPTFEMAEGRQGKNYASDADTDITDTCKGCGDDVVFDSMNGWMREDGSYGHEDGTTHSDHLPPPPEFKAEGGADRNRGGAANLRRWYVAGADGQIAWGSKGDFDQCVAVASRHMAPERAKGYCNLRHQDAVGAPPGQGHPEGKAATYDQPETTAPDKDPVTGPDQAKHTGVMVALFPGPEAAKKIAVRGGEAPEDLHVTLVYLGDVFDAAGEGLTLGSATSQIVAAAQAAAATTKPLSGTVGGLGKFPDFGNGVPVWSPVDVVGLTAAREAVVDALQAAGLPVKTDHGFTPHMTLGYNLDLNLIPDTDPVPVEFTHLVVAIGGTHTRIPLGDDLGADASGAAIAGTPTQPEQDDPMEKGYDPMIETGPHAGHKAAVPAEVAKAFPRLPGTLEERTQALSGALDEALLGNFDDDARKERYVNIDGTWMDRVICTLNHWSSNSNDSCQSYEFPYTISEDGTVSLGEPSPVKLTLTAELDGDEVDDVPAGDLMPLVERINDVIHGLKTLGPVEIKAGRVLSASIAARLKSAAEHLVSVLKAGGIDITLPAEETVAPVVETETTAPSAHGKSANLNPSDVAALLADIETITAE
jgi:2'-5' RNA ligase